MYWSSYNCKTFNQYRAAWTLLWHIFGHIFYPLRHTHSHVRKPYLTFTGLNMFWHRALWTKKPRQYENNRMFVIFTCENIVFATRIVQFLFLLTPKFQTSTHGLLFPGSVCVNSFGNPKTSFLASRLFWHQTLST